MYRVYSTGTAIECDCAEDVAALLVALALPKMASVVVSRPAKKRELKVERRPAPADGDSAEASERRAALLALIRKAEFGLTLGELRRQTAKMDGRDRSNALQSLKLRGEIRRLGNTWKAA